MADALVSQFVEFLTSMAKEEVRMLLGAEDALRQLKEDVRAFSGVLRDAERRAFTDHAFRRWLADVKDLVYDADDIIDYSRTHAEKFFRMSTEEHPVGWRMLSVFFLFLVVVCIAYVFAGGLESTPVISEFGPRRIVVSRTYKTKGSLIE